MKKTTKTVSAFLPFALTSRPPSPPPHHRPNHLPPRSTLARPPAHHRLPAPRFASRSPNPRSRSPPPTTAQHYAQIHPRELIQIHPCGSSSSSPSCCSPWRRQLPRLRPRRRYLRGWFTGCRTRRGWRRARAGSGGRGAGVGSTTARW